MQKLENKVAIITGAASGMGKEMAILFAQEGATVIGVDINEERLHETSEQINQSNGKFISVWADITKQENIDNIFNTAIEKAGTVDILVNNAGIMDNFEPVGDITDEIFERVMKINVEAPMKLTRAAINLFLQKGSGNIINIASLAGLNGARGGASYTMSKHAIVGLTKNTGFIYAKKGIRCNAIAPGAVGTNINESINPAKISKIGMEAINPGLALNPRIGAPTELAKATLFLASDDSSFINGEVITVDGGWSAY